jgi:poly-gamma-glutamate capsule biosynthesis protein CapA/YwtB (metallophosphatase superfamily)
MFGKMNQTKLIKNYWLGLLRKCSAINKQKSDYGAWMAF